MTVSQFKDALRWPTVARTIRPDLGLRKRSHSDISCQTDLTGILCSSDIEITQAKRTLSLSLSLGRPSRILGRQPPNWHQLPRALQPACRGNPGGLSSRIHRYFPL